MTLLNQHFKDNFLYLILLIFWLPGCKSADDIPDFTASNTGPYIYKIEHLEAVKNNLDSDPLLREEYKELIQGTEELLTVNFKYVTDKNFVPPSGDKNDYMSIARYLWPDSSGAYTIYRDGITNPEIYDYDRPILARFSSAVHSLALSYYLSGEEKYAKKASELLNGWFIDSETKMNPNMDYAQVAKGVNNNSGSKQGIIDANDFIQVIEGASLIYDSHHWTSSKHRELKSWFYNFSIWIIKNYNADAFVTTNISTWLDVQRAIFFLFSEQEERLNSETYFIPVTEKIETQFNTEGIQVNEITRGRPDHYVYFNLKGYMNLALIRKKSPVTDRDWPALSTADHGGLRPALELLQKAIERGTSPNEESNFDICRYLEIFKPAAIAFETSEYDQTSKTLLSRGCRNPDINLTFPTLEVIHSNSNSLGL